MSLRGFNTIIGSYSTSHSSGGAEDLVVGVEKHQFAACDHWWRHQARLNRKPGQLTWWLIKYLDLSHNLGTFTDIFHLEWVELKLQFFLCQHFQPSALLIIPDFWEVGVNVAAVAFGPHQYSEPRLENKISFDFIASFWGCSFTPHSISPL